MATPLQSKGIPWLGFLMRELTPFPGRFAPVLRTLLSCALVIVISMTLQIPFLALSLIVIFFITQPNAAVTKMVGMMFVMGVPLSIGLSTLLLKFTFDYPLLRLAGASLIFITCMFFLRTSRFSLVFFAIAFIVIYAQSLVDIVPDPEALLRTTLWVGAATFYAIVITLLVNTVFFAVEPRVQFTRYAQGQIAMIEGRLSLLALGMPVPPLGADAVQRSILTLQKLLRFCAMRSDEYARYEDYYVAIVIALSRLLMASATLSRLPTGDKYEVSHLVQGCHDLALSVRQRQPLQFTPHQSEGVVALPLQEMQRAFLAVADNHQLALVPKAKTRAPFFVAPDALTNPRYLKFALKAYFATLLCYVFYNSVDWPGIHTIMLTCVITSLPNLGASAQKGVLRIAGCLVGAALSLIAMIFIFPQLDTLFGMLLVSLAVVALSAWVCAGSDKIAYAGTQIIFCFALALLEDFAPVYDLTLIRDRLIGIVLGVAVTTAIQVLVWPENEERTLIAKLGQMLGNIANSLKSFTEQPGQEKASTLAGWSEIADCEAMLTRVQLESAARFSTSQAYSQWVSQLLAGCRAFLLLNHELSTSRFVPENSVASAQLLNINSDLAEVLSRYASSVSKADQTSSPDQSVSVIAQRLAGLGSLAMSAQERWVKQRLEHVAQLIEALPPAYGWQ